jgi:hypothetical protein
MAQAESITTAIRELMSRGQPPKSTSPWVAHTEFVAALAGNAPLPVHSDLKAEDLERRADHLETIFAALHVYVTAVVADTTQNIPGTTFDRRYLDHAFQRFSADAVGVIHKAAIELRVRENWSGS